MKLIKEMEGEKDRVINWWIIMPQSIVAHILNRKSR